jgi:hypothetical protein
MRFFKPMQKASNRLRSFPHRQHHIPNSCRPFVLPNSVFLLSTILLAYDAGKHETAKHALRAAIVGLIIAKRGEEAALTVADAVFSLEGLQYAGITQDAAEAFAGALEDSFEAMGEVGITPIDIAAAAAPAMEVGGSMRDIAFAALTNAAKEHCSPVRQVLREISRYIAAKEGKEALQEYERAFLPIAALANEDSDVARLIECASDAELNEQKESSGN